MHSQAKSLAGFQAEEIKFLDLRETLVEVVVLADDDGDSEQLRSDEDRVSVTL